MNAIDSLDVGHLASLGYIQGYIAKDENKELRECAIDLDEVIGALAADMEDAALEAGDDAAAEEDGCAGCDTPCGGPPAEAPAEPEPTQLDAMLEKAYRCGWVHGEEYAGQRVNATLQALLLDSMKRAVKDELRVVTTPRPLIPTRAQELHIVVQGLDEDGKAFQVPFDYDYELNALDQPQFTIEQTRPCTPAMLDKLEAGERAETVTTLQITVKQRSFHEPFTR